MKLVCNKHPAVIITSAILLLSFLFSAQITVAETNGTDTEANTNKNSRYLFSVTLHNEKEIESLLTRAESLSQSLILNKKDHAGIALVLHGREIKLFNKKNYKKFRSIVDKAARLDTEGILEIKICKTVMDDLHISKEDLPSFVEIVPYGPDEEERLLTQGYTYL